MIQSKLGHGGTCLTYDARAYDGVDKVEAGHGDTCLTYDARAYNGVDKVEAGHGDTGLELVLSLIFKQMPGLTHTGGV